MVDAEIQILITAIDEMSNTMKRIEGQLTKSNKNIEKQTKETTKSFDKEMGSLIVLGQAANTVDNIFSQYQALQLRLENATERVTGAQDRLANAQYNLSKVQKDTSSTAEDVAEAQRQLDAASRGVVISTNNLAKVNNQVIGTYISMGIQVGTLIKQMPILIASFNSLMLNPVVLAFTALAIVIGGAVLASQEYTKAQQELKDASEAVKSSQDRLAISIANVNDKTNEQIEGAKKAYDELMGITKTKSTPELQALYDIAVQEQVVADAKINSSEEAYTIQSEILEKLRDQYDATYTKQAEINSALLELENSKAQSISGIQKTADDFWRLTRDQQLLYIKETFMVKMKEYSQQIANEEIAERKRAEIENIKSYEREASARAKLNSMPNINKQTGLGGGLAAVFGLPQKSSGNISVMDAIIRPDGQVITTDPADYLIATKNPGALGGGMTIIINGDNYGVDAGDIAEALQRELSKRLSMGN